ncbi:MAG: hypothetical protein ACLQBD_27790 [Syntrophobacteraceae bacterium]
MPEKCRVVVCGFDPMLVKAYVAANARALWWHVSDELYNEFKMHPKMKVQGKLLKVYSGKTGEEEVAPSEPFEFQSDVVFRDPDSEEAQAVRSEPFEWECSNESGLAVVLPSDVIKKHKLTEFHFIELIIDKIGGKDVYPGQEKISKKWWPDDKLKLTYALDYIG